MLRDCRNADVSVKSVDYIPVLRRPRGSPPLNLAPIKPTQDILQRSWKQLN
jgi:hypothetical protein